MHERFTISDLASEFDITTRSIRFYEEKGLLSPERQGSSRVYNAADRVRLKLILRGKMLGFTLDESRDIIGMYEPESANTRQLETLLSKIAQKREYLQQQKKEIDNMLRDLDSTEAVCKAALSKQVNGRDNR